MLVRFAFSFFLVFLSCTGVGLCQDILSRSSTVEVKYQENTTPQDLAQLKFYIPLGRAYNNLIPSAGVVDAVDGVVRISFDQVAATFVSIKYGASTLSGYIEPGDTLTASIARDDQQFSFIGHRSVENNLFNNILSIDKRNIIDLTLKKKINEQTRSPEIDSGGARLWEQKSQTLQEYIDEEWNAVINPYKELLASKTIDASAYTIFATALHAEFYRRTLALMGQLNDAEKEVYRKRLFPIIYRDGMALDPLLTRVPNGKVLLTAYADSKRDTVVPAELVTEFEVFGNYSHYRSLTTIQQEYMLGRIFYLQKMLSTYDKDFKSREAFDLYKRKFPQSPFIPIIQQIHREAFEDVHVFYKKQMDDHLPDVQTAIVVDFVDNIMTVDTAVKASSLTTFL